MVFNVAVAVGLLGYLGLWLCCLWLNGILFCGGFVYVLILA